MGYHGIEWDIVGCKIKIRGYGLSGTRYPKNHIGYHPRLDIQENNPAKTVDAAYPTPLNCSFLANSCIDSGVKFLWPFSPIVLFWSPFTSFLGCSSEACSGWCAILNHQSSETKARPQSCHVRVIVCVTVQPCPSNSLIISSNQKWRFPEIGVPLVIIHFCLGFPI